MTGTATVTVFPGDWRTARITELETAVNEYAALKVAADGRALEAQGQAHAAEAHVLLLQRALDFAHQQTAAALATVAEVEDQLWQARAALLSQADR